MITWSIHLNLKCTGDGGLKLDILRVGAEGIPDDLDIKPATGGVAAVIEAASVENIRTNITPALREGFRVLKENLDALRIPLSVEGPSSLDPIQAVLSETGNLCVAVTYGRYVAHRASGARARRDATRYGPLATQ